MKKINKKNIFKEWPLVTVYITNKNYKKFLKKSIESVINQTYPNWELFIIDDNSSDKSKDFIKKFVKSKKFKIKVIFNKDSIGIQKIANNVINKSLGKYLIRLDADDWFAEDALLHLVLEMEKNNNLSLIYGNFFYVDERGIVLGKEKNFSINRKNSIKQLPPHGACTIFKISEIKKNGGYAEDVDAQDGWDIWYKLFNKDKVAHIDKDIFYYRQHPSSLSKNYDRIIKARTKILNNLNIDKKILPKCLAVIPVKESYPNSKGVPFLKFENLTLLEHALNSTLKSKMITDGLVSSSSKKVIDFMGNKEIKLKYKNFKVVKRPKNISKSVSQLQKTLIHAAQVFFKKNKVYPSVIIYLSLHTIRLNHFYIDQAINTILLKKYDSVISVNEEKDPMFLYDPNSLKLINKSRFDEVQNMSEKIFRFNGSFVAVKFEALKNGNLFRKNIGHIEMIDNDIIEIKDFSLFQNNK